MKTGRWTESKV